METDGGGWTVLQRRQDGSVDFYRNWTDYENGFGNLNGEFWLGLSKIHRLSKGGSNILRIDLKTFDGNTSYAMYSNFSVGDNNTEYILFVGEYNGTAGDSFTHQIGRKFSTADNDNDHSTSLNCAIRFNGAWWFNKCFGAYLNGPFNSIHGIYWNMKSYKFSEMKTHHND